MQRFRKPWLRGALTLGVLGVFSAGLLVSNVGAVPEGKEASKKFVRKQIKKKISQFGNPIFIEEEELVRFSVRTDVAGADTTIATIGNFTFKANCELDPGDNTIIGRVLIETSADNAAFDSDDALDTDFDTADNPGTWIGGDMNDLVGEPPASWTEDSEGTAIGPTGTTINGRGGFFTNVGGFDCTLEGYLVQTNV